MVRFRIVTGLIARPKPETSAAAKALAEIGDIGETALCFGQQTGIEVAEICAPTLQTNDNRRQRHPSHIWFATPVSDQACAPILHRFDTRTLVVAS